ncbi:hypothetical protein SELMODRAFT_441875 [Selaginella moellendorffii]|uniref:Uncharacterized protein n=1 Tax=Selaginella moellendorffii TaxID=88036 RepID=D8RNC5_SELML|nr:folate transporter 1 [Selaginella moellendorffii]EFJ26701.1 hypothetical protein SELMODRAFT_441875 [Selaginella moellendorffii]|eukprot:XP_002972615.1 folate transporter 1 [Selaginella moellendorffii]
MVDEEDMALASPNGGRAATARLPIALAVLLPSAYRFAQRFAPVIPYEVRYMIHNKGITNQEISTRILPVGVYSRSLFIFLAAPACSLFSYHGTLMLASLAVFVEYSLLLWGDSILWLQLMQLFRSMAAGIEVVFPAYLFLLVPENKFQIMTSSTEAASSIAHFGASELGQALIHEGISIDVLLYISMSMVALSVLICLVLPRDPQSSQCSDCPAAPRKSKRPPILELLSICRLKGLATVVRETWENPFVQLLSIWWAFDVAGYAMASTYMLNLFEAIDSTSIYSGHVMAATEITNFIAALCAIPLSVLVARDAGIAYYTAGSVLIGVLLLSMPYTATLWVAYPGFIVIVGINRILVCIVHVQCARFLANKEYVLLFSLNTLAGRILQSVFQFVIVMVAPTIFTQYYILGSSFLAMAAAFFLLSLYKTRNLKDSADPYYQTLPGEDVLA